MRLATGDDGGTLKLFKFPCLEKNVRIFFGNNFKSSRTNWYAFRKITNKFFWGVSL